MTEVDIECIVVGQAGVGKSTMVATLNDRHYHNIEPTIGVEFSSKEMEVELPSAIAAPDSKIQVKLWDTAGQERYRSLIKSYFRKKALAFLVFDVTSGASFRACEFWWRELQKHGSSQMLVVLVGNKCEPKMEPFRVVHHVQARDWAKDKGVAYYEVSARQNSGIQTMFEEYFLLEHYVDHDTY